MYGDNSLLFHKNVNRWAKVLWCGYRSGGHVWTMECCFARMLTERVMVKALVLGTRTWTFERCFFTRMLTEGRTRYGEPTVWQPRLHNQTPSLKSIAQTAKSQCIPLFPSTAKHI